MIALLRWIARKQKRDIAYLRAYQRSHHHFFWFLGVDALISILGIVISFQFFAGSRNLMERALEHSGGIGLSIDKLTDLVRKDNFRVYWLGAMENQTYSLSHSVEDVQVITYLPQGTSPGTRVQERLTVATYESYQAFEARAHAVVNADSHTVIADKGFTIAYDSHTLSSMTVTFQRSLEVVVVTYPTKQTPAQLLQDAGKLDVIE